MEWLIPPARAGVPLVHPHNGKVVLRKLFERGSTGVHHLERSSVGSMLRTPQPLECLRLGEQPGKELEGPACRVRFNPQGVESEGGERSSLVGYNPEVTHPGHLHEPRSGCLGEAGQHQHRQGHDPVGVIVVHSDGPEGGRKETGLLECTESSLGR